MSILATVLVNDHVRAWFERSRRARAEESASRAFCRWHHYYVVKFKMKALQGAVLFAAWYGGYMVILHDLDG